MLIAIEFEKESKETKREKKTKKIIKGAIIGVIE